MSGQSIAHLPGVSLAEKQSLWRLYGNPKPFAKPRCRACARDDAIRKSPPLLCPGPAF